MIETARADSGLACELVDLKDWHLPMDDEPAIPASGVYAQDHSLAWSRKIAAAPGFVFVSPQYNWGYPAAPEERARPSLQGMGRQAGGDRDLWRPWRRQVRRPAAPGHRGPAHARGRNHAADHAQPLHDRRRADFARNRFAGLSRGRRDGRPANWRRALAG
ncbi:MAG: NAD(P)H-dependent oxidoreductase [Asticcacaulis sp.]